MNEDNKIKLQEASNELEKVTAQANALSDEAQNWKVNTAGLASNPEIEELYDNAVVLFDSMLNKINAAIASTTKRKVSLETLLENGESCGSAVRRLQKELTKLDFLVSGLEAYLYFCKKDVREILGEDELS